MPQEIERKFEVATDGWRSAVTSVSTIRQGYLAATGQTTLRVRIVDDAEAVITIKLAGPSSRQRGEYEYPIPLVDARELMAAAGDHTLGKRRSMVEHDGRSWSVDEFDGKLAGLVLAEIEFERADEEVSLPGWIGDEVTDRREYTNAQLAARPG